MKKVKCAKHVPIKDFETGNILCIFCQTILGEFNVEKENREQNIIKLEKEHIHKKYTRRH